LCEHPTQVAGWMWRRKLELELELELVTESGASSLQWPPVASHEIYALKLHNWATHTHRHRVTQTGETLHINSGSQGNGEKFLTRPHHELKLNSLGPYQIKHFLVLGRLLIEVRTRRCTDTRIQRSTCSDGRCTIQSTHDSPPSHARKPATHKIRESRGKKMLNLIVFCLSALASAQNTRNMAPRSSAEIKMK